MNLRILSLFAAGLLGLLPAGSLFAQPAVVGHPGLSSEKIDAATLKSVLLGRKVAWDGAGRVTLAVLKSGPIAEEALKTHADLSLSAFNNHWRRLAMTGGGTAPKAFDNEADLKKFVAETPGAIGFLDRAQVDASIIVLTPGA